MAAHALQVVMLLAVAYISSAETPNESYPSYQIRGARFLHASTSSAERCFGVGASSLGAAVALHIYKNSSV
jgi:hypothetical protein